MSPPRFLLPDSLYLVTHRCSERRLFLTPLPFVNQAFKFCLFHAAARHQISLHAFCALSNHYHLVLTDPDQNLPKFMCWFNGNLARCLNAYYGRHEAFWTNRPYSAQRLGDEAALLDKLVYTLTNPVSSGLVSRPEEWPGALSEPEDMASREFRLERPQCHFRKHGPVPEETRGRLSVPDTKRVREQGPEAFIEEVRQQMEARVAEIQQEKKARGESFLGRQEVLRKHWSDSPTTPAPRGRLNPRVACKNKDRREAMILAELLFRRLYREAYEAYCAGDREVIFPAGTYWMRHHLGVKCHPVPT